MSTDILSPVGRSRLRRMALSNVLIGLDFDGTLAPIVTQRDHASMRPTTAQLLHALCERYPCAVISGRSRDDLVTRIADAHPRLAFGNHGIEPSAEQERQAACIHALKPHVALRIAPIADVELEDKHYSLSLHYRRASDPDATRQRLLDALCDLTAGLRSVDGKRVLNLVPRHAPHKGDALLRACALVRADCAIYVGDDITDEDAFRLRHRHLLSIAVGRRRSAAWFHLRSQAAIDPLLSLLVQLRASRG